MIKFKGSDDLGTIWGFGLGRDNVKKLKAGMPIKVDLRDMGGERDSVVIMYGETEQEMVDQLREHGMIDDDCKVNEQPKHHEG